MNKILYTKQKSIICNIQYGYKSDMMMMMMMMMIVHCEKSAFISVNIHLLIPTYSSQTPHHISTKQFFVIISWQLQTTSIPSDLSTHTTPCHLKVSHHFPFNDPVGTSCLLVMTVMSSQRSVTYFWNLYRKHQVWSSVKNLLENVWIIIYCTAVLPLIIVQPSHYFCISIIGMIC
jgi:hypothetical protein